MYRLSVSGKKKKVSVRYIYIFYLKLQNSIVYMKLDFRLGKLACRKLDNNTAWINAFSRKIIACVDLEGVGKGVQKLKVFIKYT